MRRHLKRNITRKSTAPQVETTINSLLREAKEKILPPKEQFFKCIPVPFDEFIDGAQKLFKPAVKYIPYVFDEFWVNLLINHSYIKAEGADDFQLTKRLGKLRKEPKEKSHART
jgi:hypothetical protein